MAYKYDKDLEFLRELNDEVLNDLVKTLTHDDDGKPRYTEELTKNELYKKHYPQHEKYIEAIMEELQKFGGNTIANKFRDSGILYKEILQDVAEKLKINFNKDDTILEIEEKILKDTFKKSIEKLSPEELKELSQSLDLKDVTNYSKDVILKYTEVNSSLVLMFGISQMLIKAINQSILKFTAGAVTQRAGASFLGPIGMTITGLWTLNDIAGTAFRVTIPAVFHIIHLRQHYLLEKQELEKKQREKKQLKEKIQDGKKYSINELFDQKLNILIAGPTGAGKSSTIKALFEYEGKELDIEIGTTAKPETKEVKDFKLDNLTIYDSPGFGDSEENDKIYKNQIEELLKKKGDEEIDLVLITLNGANLRDLGTFYNLIKDTIMPTLKDKKRILIAINKCDKASDIPNSFDYEKNQPSRELIEKLNEDVEIIKKRIHDDTKINVDIIYYAAGYTDKTKKKQKSYNLKKLLAYIIDKTPTEKRFVYLKYKSQNETNFQDNDNIENYNEKIGNSFIETLKEYAVKGVEIAKDFIDFIKSEQFQEFKNFSKEIFDIFKSSKK
ncbi:DUF3944 domain-containing protein [Campylobacter sp. S4:11]|uniref:DUF3944 domain-containing protein n=1 Tax=Campylobacter sp. S4:11 TaxID=2735745 RepID=UPI00301DEC9E|nr:DUF3944 domain-containing protein [Campylobacter sp. S4:11]